MTTSLSTRQVVTLSDYLARANGAQLRQAIEGAVKLLTTSLPESNELGLYSREELLEAMDRVQERQICLLRLLATLH